MLESMRIVKTTAPGVFLVASILVLMLNCYVSATVNGVYHRVQKGETVWQISRAYRVDMETIAKANRLGRRMRIKAGQYLFIPKVKKTVRIEPEDSQTRYILRYGTSMRWKYIVIHHSGTDKGSARVFDRNHRSKRHFLHGLGYHFVVCNGSYGRDDGQIEVGRRWWSQLDGAHCRGDGNRVGIGICLVGNFNNTKPTKKQYASLVRLVTHLSYKFNIPIENVKGHSQMQGANTECPGKNFPWQSLKKALRERGCR